jgi:hypothetical protein
MWGLWHYQHQGYDEDDKRSSANMDIELDIKTKPASDFYGDFCD